MKKVGLTLLALSLAFSLIACSSPASSKGESSTSEIIAATSMIQSEAIVYYFEDMDFTLEFPVDFWNALMIVDGDNSIYFSHLESYNADCGGELFSILARSPEDAVDIPEDMYTNLGEHNGLVYMMFKPTDVQFSPETMEEYEALFSQVDDIVATFRFGKD